MFELTAIIAICFAFGSVTGILSASWLGLMALCLRLQFGIPAVICCIGGVIQSRPEGLLIAVGLALGVAIWPLASARLKK